MEWHVVWSPNTEHNRNEANHGTWRKTSPGVRLLAWRWLENAILVIPKALAHPARLNPEL